MSVLALLTAVAFFAGPSDSGPPVRPLVSDSSGSVIDSSPEWLTETTFKIEQLTQLVRESPDGPTKAARAVQLVELYRQRGLHHREEALPEAEAKRRLHAPPLWPIFAASPTEKLARQDLLKSIAVGEYIVRTFREYPMAHLFELLVLSYLDVQEPAKATANLSKLEALDPKSQAFARSLVALADFNVASMRVHDAELHYEKALDIAAPDLKRYAELRLAQCRRGIEPLDLGASPLVLGSGGDGAESTTAWLAKTSALITSLTKHLKGLPESDGKASETLRLAELHWLRSLRHHQKAMRSYNEEYDAWFNRDDASRGIPEPSYRHHPSEQLSIEDMGKAIALYEAVLQTHRGLPGSGNAFENLVLCYLYLNDAAKAAAVLERLEGIDPSTQAVARSHVALGDFLLSMRRAREASLHFEKALKIAEGELKVRALQQLQVSRFHLRLTTPSIFPNRAE